MKTFEEFQFKIKHSNINSNIIDEKKLIELKIGDWFYGITDRSYEYSQVSHVKQESYGLEIYFDYDTNSWSVYCDNVHPKSKYDDEDCTLYVDNLWCITTIESVAEEWHQKLCPKLKLKTIPFKL